MFARCIGFLVLAATLIHAAPPSQAYDICASATDCLALGESIELSRQPQQALDLLAAAADLATGSGDDQTLLSAFEGLTKANIELGKPLMAHAWAQAAMIHFGDNPAAKENLARAQQALPAIDPAAGISGTYDSYAGYGNWSEMRISARADGTLLMDWFLQRFGAVPSAYDYGPAAMWEMSADGAYRNGEMTISYAGSDDKTCELKFTKSDLGFEWTYPKAEDLSEACRIGGANVFPWGPFWLVDQTDPQLDNAED